VERIPRPETRQRSVSALCRESFVLGGSPYCFESRLNRCADAQQIVPGERGIALPSTSFVRRGLRAHRPRHLNSTVRQPMLGFKDFMQLLKATVSILFLLCFSASGLGQKSDDDGTILLGRHYGFILKEPNGWVIDDATAKSQGLEAVLYREGSSWKQAVAVMYVRVIHKDKRQPTAQKVIADDVSEFLKQRPESKVSDSPELATRDKKKVVVKGFFDATNKNYDSVAFIDEPKVVVILALSSRDKNELEKSLPAFKALVGSYFFVKELVEPR